MPEAVRDALIVAGGRGTRLQPLTYTTPKPLLPFCGAPFLSGVIRRLATAGVQRVFLVVGADTAPFAVLRDDAASVGVEIAMVPEPEPLDTAGGVREVADELTDTFLVLNGDILTDVDVTRVVAHHRRAGADGTLVLTEVEDTASYGVAVRDGTQITRFVEKPAPGALPGQNAINAGTYVLEPTVFDGLPRGPLSFERRVFPDALERGLHLEGFVESGVWADLGTPSRFLAGHALALDGELAWPTVAAVPETSPGVRVADGAEVAPDAVLEGPVLVLGGARVGAGAQIGPHVVLGRDARVGEKAVVRRSVLFDDARIGEAVEATGLIAGFGAHVDAGARLGRGVVLGDCEHVGDGVVLDDGQRVPPREG